MSRYAIPPKLPVPSLSGSLERFLTALKPLLSPTDFSEAVRLTGIFSERQGPYLHAKLLQLAEETDNWAGYVSVYMRYLTNRSSILLTNGMGTFLQPIHVGIPGALLHSLSIYICTNLASFTKARYNMLTQDMFDNEPLCMEQYKNLFGVSRLPGLNTDTFCQSPTSRHIIVMHAGSMYKVPVYSIGGEKPLGLQDIYSLLSQVLTYTQGTRREGNRGVGLLTALERDQWYLAREQLIKSPINRESLSAVEGCLFVVSLDDYEAEHLSNSSKLKFGLFGDLKNPYFNRWYGLSTQSMVSSDGYLSILTEHSLVDGNLKAELAKLESRPIDPDYKIDQSLKIELLEWDISPLLQREIEKAKIMVNTLYDGYNVHRFVFTEYGKEFVKNHGIYFQGYIQLALQLAYYKLYNGLAASYQPVSLRRFHGGRLENPHVVSLESKSFVESMSKDCDNRERYKLMRLAVNRHKELMSDANQGQAYCKHILGLKMLADKEGLNIELFQKDFYSVFTQHRLAASIVYKTIPLISLYPMASRMGHFVIFQVEDNSINFSVTTLLHSEQTLTSEEFSAKISASLCEIQQLVVTQATSGMLDSKL